MESPESRSQLEPHKGSKLDMVLRDKPDPVRQCQLQQENERDFLKHVVCSR